MTPRHKFVIVPPRKADLAVKGSKPKPQNRSVEHVKYGIGNLLHVRPLDGGMFAAVVNFNGVDRTIRLSPAYFITPISEIMAFAPHLAPPKPVSECGCSGENIQPAAHGTQVITSTNRRIVCRWNLLYRSTVRSRRA
jgi:hypothetical protein